MPASPRESSTGAVPVLRRVALFWVAYFVILFLAAIPRGMAPPPWAQLTWGLVATPPLLALAVFLARREVPALGTIGASPAGHDVVPLFGGMPGSGALARTAVNVRSGAQTRLAAIVHAAVLFGGPADAITLAVTSLGARGVRITIADRGPDLAQWHVQVHR